MCLAVWLVACASTPLEAKYPKAAVQRADRVILDPKDIELISGYHNLGIVSGLSCKDKNEAEKMIRLEAAKSGANKVVRLRCWEAGPLSPCLSTTYYCKGKAIATDDDAMRQTPDQSNGS